MIAFRDSESVPRTAAEKPRRLPRRDEQTWSTAIAQRRYRRVLPRFYISIPGPPYYLAQHQRIRYGRYQIKRRSCRNVRGQLCCFCWATHGAPAGDLFAQLTKQQSISEANFRSSLPTYLA